MLKLTSAAAAAPIVLLVTAASALADVSITSQPPPFTQSQSATFNFTVDPPGAQCALDSSTEASFGDCASPQTYNGVSEGQHTVYIRQKSASGTPGTPHSVTWTVDLTPPDTSLTGQPPSLTNSRDASFSFTGADANLDHFECSINGGPPSVCTSPQSYVGLGDGTRSFSVVAVDKAGNRDTSPPQASWTVDATPPDTTITSGPSGLTNHAAFEFGASEPGATYMCQLDAAPFAPCKSPYSATSAPDGKHTFAVAAVDAAGNLDPTPARRAFTIDTKPPASAKVLVGPLPPDRHVKKPHHRRGKALHPGSGEIPPDKKLKKTAIFQLQRKLIVQWRFPGTLGRATSARSGNKYELIYLSFAPGGGDLKTKTVHMAKSSKPSAVGFLASPGRTYCFRMVSTDAAGNSSDSNDACTALPAKASQLERDQFTLESAPGHYLDQLLLGNHGSVSLPLRAFDNEFESDRFSLEHVALVVTKCSACGKVAVTPNWPLADQPKSISVESFGKVNTHATATKHLQLIPLGGYSDTLSGLQGLSGGTTIDVKPLTGTAKIEGIAVFSNP